MKPTCTPRTNPLWGDDWSALRELWRLDPEIAYLNHGSFGATPHPILNEQSRLRLELESDPVHFFVRIYPDLLKRARETVGAFINADPDGLAFIPNATAGVNHILKCLSLGPEDDMVISDHGYGAVIKTLRRIAELHGPRLIIAPVPLSVRTADEIADTLLSALTPRTRLLVVDHIASATAVIFPIDRIVAECRKRGVLVLVDSAHGPGMLPVDVNRLAPDFWTGNFHKWCCAPKGSAALWVAPQHRVRIRPLITSHGYDKGFRDEFDWTGTADPTAFLATPFALAFLENLGWQRIRTHNHTLALQGREVVCRALGTEPPIADPDRLHGSMTLVALPEGVVSNETEGDRLHDLLWDEYRVQVPVMAWNGRGYVRLSAHVHNCPADYDRLAVALPDALARKW